MKAEQAEVLAEAIEQTVCAIVSATVKMNHKHDTLSIAHANLVKALTDRLNS